jgi:hypothetical protein
VFGYFSRPSIPGPAQRTTLPNLARVLAYGVVNPLDSQILGYVPAAKVGAPTDAEGELTMNVLEGYSFIVF